MLKESFNMQLSYVFRRKSTAIIMFVLLFFVVTNIGMNFLKNYNAVYLSQMYGFEKMLTLSDWSMMGYFLRQFYPMLLVIPTACTYIIDKNTGMNVYIQSKVGRRDYLYGKMLVTFVLTFIMFTLPFMMEIIISSICTGYIPNGDPSGFEYWQTIAKESEYILSKILLCSKGGYAVCMTILFGIVSAIFAVFNFSITLIPIFKTKIATYFPIYILLYAIALLPKMIKLKFTVNYNSILAMFETSTNKNYGVYFIFLLVLIVTSIMLVEIKIRKEDVL